MFKKSKKNTPSYVSGEGASLEQKGRRKKVGTYVIVALLLTAIIVGAVAASLSVTAQNHLEQELISAFKETLTQYEPIIEEIAGDITGTMGVKSSTYTLYDSSDKRMFSVMGTSSVSAVTNVPDFLITQMISVFTGTFTEIPIDFEVWCEIQALAEDPEEYDLSYLKSQSIGWAVVAEYAYQHGLDLSDEAAITVAAGLEEEFTTRQLIEYLMTTLKFGGWTGADVACKQWFGKELSALNEAQQTYIAYACNNPTANYAEFQSLYPDLATGTAGIFGLLNLDTKNWLLYQYVQKELDVIGQDLPAGSYNVKLSIDDSVQNAVQEAIDTEMQTSVLLSSNGNTVLDGSAIVVDSQTGFVVSVIGGRSVNDIEAELKFTGTSPIASYVKGKEMMATDDSLVYNLLVDYEDADGNLLKDSFSSLVANGGLDVLGATVEYKEEINLYDTAEFLLGLYTDVTPRFIEQIQTESGTTVYAAKPATSTFEASENAGMRCLLMQSTAGPSVDFVQYAEAGVAIATATSEYIVVGCYGGGASGYTMDETDYKMCVITAEEVLTSIADVFDNEYKENDPNGVIAEKVSKAKEGNTSYVKELAQSLIDYLDDYEIVSTTSATEFVEIYNYVVEAVHSMYGLVEDEVLTGLLEEVEEVRTERTDTLMEYAS